MKRIITVLLMFTLVTCNMTFISNENFNLGKVNAASNDEIYWEITEFADKNQKINFLYDGSKFILKEKDKDKKLKLKTTDPFSKVEISEIRAVDFLKKSNQSIKPNMNYEVGKNMILVNIKLKLFT